MKIFDLEQALLLREKIDKINSKKSHKEKQKDLCKIILEQEKIIKELNTKNDNKSNNVSSENDIYNIDQNIDKDMLIMELKQKIETQYIELSAEKFELLDKNEFLTKLVDNLNIKVTTQSTKLIDLE